MKRCYSITALQLVLLFAFCSTGCNSISKWRGQSPDVTTGSTDPESQEFITDITTVWGLSYAKVEGIALATQLEGRGSDPKPSQQRAYLVSEMRANDVAKPNEVLASEDTSLVLVRGFMPPGIRKGDRFDVEIRTLPGGDTKSLRGGFLMETSLRQMEAMGGRVLQGHIVGGVKGPIIVDAVYDRSDEQNENRGRVLGMAVAKYDRPLGLAISSENHSVRITAAIAKAINNRFHVVDNGGLIGAATPKNDRHIELSVPPRYKHNLARYLEVVGQIKYRESSQELAKRLMTLEKQLLEPSTTKRAALKLEAIGETAVDVLKTGMESPDAEVRFSSAMALAYMDVPESAKELGSAAKVERAFRWNAMTALAAMDDVEAGMQLSELLDMRSAETRYGAFYALRVRSPSQSVFESTLRPDDFFFHVVPSKSFPMIHFSKYKRPEIALFGHDQTVKDNFLFVKKGLTIRALEGTDKIKISKFSRRDDDVSQVCSNQVVDLIQSLVSIDMDFGEILEVFQDAKASEMLNSKLVIDATPKPGRNYERESDEITPEEPSRFVGGPIPDLFRGSTEGREQKWRPNETAAYYEDEDAGRKKNKGFMNRLTGWWGK